MKLKTIPHLVLRFSCHYGQIHHLNLFVNIERSLDSKFLAIGWSPMADLWLLKSLFSSKTHILFFFFFSFLSLSTFGQTLETPLVCRGKRTVFPLVWLWPFYKNYNLTSISSIISFFIDSSFGLLNLLNSGVTWMTRENDMMYNPDTNFKSYDVKWYDRKEMEWVVLHGLVNVKMLGSHA